MKFCDVFKSAKYILPSKQYEFPYIRSVFNVQKKIKRASLNISVLGFCELYLNGKKITKDLFITPYSQYNKQNYDDVPERTRNNAFFNDELRYSILYSQFDVTEFLSQGKNVLGIIISGGWYRSGFDKHKSYRNYGRTKACFLLTVEYENGEILDIFSDKNAKWNESFLVEAGIFSEEQDERKELRDFAEPYFDDGAWQNVVEVEEPYAEYRLNTCPPDRIIRWITPVLIKETQDYKIYDMGENITGFPVIHSQALKNQIITCEHSESITEGLDLDESHIYEQKSVFKTDERTEHHIRFTWHGFRYIKISTTGKLENLHCEKCAVVHADIRNTSTFVSDSEMLNWFYDAYVRSQLGNYHCGLPTDCPQIERKAYTGDGQLLAETGMMLFNSRELYKKWLQDISDCQDRKTGFVHYTAPCFIGCGGGPGGWSVAIITVPYAYYKAYGEPSILAEFYPQMRQYLRFMDEESVDGLINMHRRKGDWCLGDWESPSGREHQLNPVFVNSCMYVDALILMQEIAVLCGESKDAEKYCVKADELRTNIHRCFYDEHTSNYCGNEQGANAFALKCGLGNEETLKNLVDYYQKLKRFDTGIFATKILVEVLIKHGYQDLAFDLIDSNEEISFKTWKNQGATTLFESWKNARSFNHPMFGALTQYFFQYILGIRQKEDSCGYQKILVNPLPFEKIKKCNGSLETVNGVIRVAFEAKEDFMEFCIEIPEQMEAEFVYKDYTKMLSTQKNIFTIKYSR